ncbi:MAG TPA: 3-deoxy-D-manno-octulosonate 8-phosphate phosphatase, partial [Burkholderiaceae bacterium]
LLTRAGFGCAPPGAHAEAKAAAAYVTQAAAGYGAAREFCDLLLMAAGHYERLLHSHHDTLDGGKS